MTGFLAPSGAPDTQRAQDAEEEFDAPSDPLDAGDDAPAPERGSGKRVFLPSSIGLSLMADPGTVRLDATVSWGDYAPEAEDAGAAEAETGEGEGESPAAEGATPAAGRRRFSPWARRPRNETISIDLGAVAARHGKPAHWSIPRSGGLQLVALARPTRPRVAEGQLDALSVSVFVVNRRAPEEDDDIQDAAFAFQTELTVAADRPLVPRHDPSGLDSDDWDERPADLHYRDAVEYAVGHNVSARADMVDGACRRVHTEWMPLAAVDRIEPAPIEDVEFSMEALGDLADGAAARRALGPLVQAYRGWIDAQRARAETLDGQRRDVARELANRAALAADRIQAGIDLLADGECAGGVPPRQPRDGGGRAPTRSARPGHRSRGRRARPSGAPSSWPMC